MNSLGKAVQGVLLVLGCFTLLADLPVGLTTQPIATPESTAGISFQAQAPFTFEVERSTDLKRWERPRFWSFGGTQSTQAGFFGAFLEPQLFDNAFYRIRSPDLPKLRLQPSAGPTWPGKLTKLGIAWDGAEPSGPVRLRHFGEASSITLLSTNDLAGGAEIEVAFPKEGRFVLEAEGLDLHGSVIVTTNEVVVGPVLDGILIEPYHDLMGLSVTQAARVQITGAQPPVIYKWSFGTNRLESSSSQWTFSGKTAGIYPLVCEITDGRGAFRKLSRNIEILPFDDPRRLVLEDVSINDDKLALSSSGTRRVVSQGQPLKVDIWIQNQDGAEFDEYEVFVDCWAFRDQDRRKNVVGSSFGLGLLSKHTLNIRVASGAEPDIYSLRVTLSARVRNANGTTRFLRNDYEYFLRVEKASDGEPLPTDFSITAILVNGQPFQTSPTVKAGDLVEVFGAAPAGSKVQIQDPFKKKTVTEMADTNGRFTYATTAESIPHDEGLVVSLTSGQEFFLPLDYDHQSFRIPETDPSGPYPNLPATDFRQKLARYDHTLRGKSGHYYDPINRAQVVIDRSGRRNFFDDDGTYFYEEDPSGVNTISALKTGKQAISVPWGVTYCFNLGILIEDRSDYRGALSEMEMLSRKISQTAGIVVMFFPLKDEELFEEWEQWAEWGKGALFVAGAFVPGVAQALDAQCVADPSLSDFERAACAASLTADGISFAASIVTAGGGAVAGVITPNAGGMIKARRIFRSITFIEKSEDAAAVVSKRFEEFRSALRRIHEPDNPGRYTRSFLNDLKVRLWGITDVLEAAETGFIVEDVISWEKYRHAVNLNFPNPKSPRQAAKAFDLLFEDINEARSLKAYNILRADTLEKASKHVEGQIKKLEKLIAAGEIDPRAIGRSHALEIVMPIEASVEFIPDFGPELAQFAKERGITLYLTVFE